MRILFWDVYILIFISTLSPIIILILLNPFDLLSNLLANTAVYTLSRDSFFIFLFFKIRPVFRTLFLLFNYKSRADYLSNLLVIMNEFYWYVRIWSAKHLLKLSLNAIEEPKVFEVPRGVDGGWVL